MQTHFLHGRIQLMSAAASIYTNSKPVESRLKKLVGSWLAIQCTCTLDTVVLFDVLACMRLLNWHPAGMLHEYCLVNQACCTDDTKQQWQYGWTSGDVTSTSTGQRQQQRRCCDDTATRSAQQFNQSLARRQHRCWQQRRLTAKHTAPCFLDNGCCCTGQYGCVINICRYWAHGNIITVYVFEMPYTGHCDERLNVWFSEGI